MTEARPAPSFLCALALISAAALAYEVLLMRLFSIIQWYHFAAMIISLALLGYGVSGTFLALYRKSLQQRFPVAILANIVLFGIAMPGCFAVAQQLPFNPEEILWAPRQWLYLFCLYLLLALPFFFAANVIGLSLYHYQAGVGAIYASDLIGAGAGSVGIIALLFGLFPEKIPIVLAEAVLVVALIVCSVSFRRQRDTKFLPVIIVLMAVVAFSGGLKLNLSPYKSERQLLRIPGTKVIARDSGPLGLLSVVESDTTPLRYAPGLSLNATVEPPEQLAVFIDADTMTVIDRYDGNPAPLSYLDQTTAALPYHLRPLRNSLVLGAGTGSDVLLALFHGIQRIDAVELNPQIIDLVGKQYADFAGHLYQHPQIHVHIGEARGFVATRTERYDLINLSLLDAFGTTAGLYALSENYLYTVQGLQAYLQRLAPGGYLSITRWINLPPRDMLKLMATAIQSCRSLALDHPERRLALIRSWQTSTLIIKNGVFSQREINQLQQFNRERGFDAAYYPGISADVVNRNNILRQPYFYQAATALLGTASASFKKNYKFNIEPDSDDRPYFFHFFKWKTLPEIVSLYGQGGVPLLESGYLLLLAALVQALIASLILIAVPLRLGRARLGIRAGARNYRKVLIYFVCLGLAFLFIEIAFIQKFILILHHPLYAVTAVLSTFLVTAGAGSLCSKKLSGHWTKTGILWPVTGIILLSAIYLFGFDALTNGLLQAGGAVKWACSVLLVAPLGFLMGMPFPIALASLARNAPALIPWAWGVNGCASVISAILAALVAMQWGFTILILSALMLYLAAVFVFPR